MSEERYIYVTAQVVWVDDDGWRNSIGVPTFVLDADIQGIRSREHAESIARKIIDPRGVLEVHPVVTMPGGWPNAD